MLYIKGEGVTQDSLHIEALLFGLIIVNLHSN
jgi:hypothetical protein